METEVKIGWSTWASSRPKDYLAKYATQAGPEQFVIVDNVLPPVYKGRSSDAQARQTHLYHAFIDQMGKALESNIEIQDLSDIADTPGFLHYILGTSLSHVYNAMPKSKRNQFPELPLHELIHGPLQEYTYNLMEERGVHEILLGSGQKGLAGECHARSVVFNYVDAKTPTYEHLIKSGHPNAEGVIDVLELWRRSKLLKGHSHLDKREDYLASLPRERESILGWLEALSERQKDTTMLIAGGTAQLTHRDTPDYRSDLDVVILSKNLWVPDGFSDVPESVREGFESGHIPQACLKQTIRGIPTSVRIVRRDLLDHYIDNRPVPTWRQDPLYNRGKRGETNVGIDGVAYETDFQEHAYPDGGSVVYQQRVAENGTPLVDSTMHMVLTGRILSDTNCDAGIKLSLVRQLEEEGNVAQIPQMVQKVRSIHPEIVDELEALVHVLK